MAPRKGTRRACDPCSISMCPCPRQTPRLLQLTLFSSSSKQQEKCDVTATTLVRDARRRGKSTSVPAFACENTRLTLQLTHPAGTVLT